MDNDRLPRKSYNMLYDLDIKGKNNWASNVRICLYEIGLGYAWENQGVGDENVFMHTLRQRLIDSRWQTWNSHVQISERFTMYRAYTSDHSVKNYLLLDMESHMRRILTKFRLGISDIKVHKYRYNKVHDSDLICPLCNEAIEDEVHFVLKCPALLDLRLKFIHKRYLAYPCLFRLCLLMAANDNNTIRNFALFLHRAFRLRETLTS
jgi:hypothetical protein